MTPSWRKPPGLPRTDSSVRPALLLAALLLASAAPAAENPRWDFLRINLGLFPGTEEIFQPDDRLFWKLKPNLKAIQAAEKLPEKEFPFQISTDAQGRRLTPAAPPSAASVLFLGDSCTFGIPVNDDETFPSQVQKMLGNIQAINAGTPGYSAFQGRLLLEGLPQSDSPTLIVITFWMNGGSVWDHLSDAEHQELLAAEREGSFSRHRLTRLLRRATPGNRPRLSEEEFAQEIRAIVRLSRERGAKPILQIWPHQKQMSEPLIIPRQEILRAIAGEQSVPLVDLVPLFRESKNTSLFADPVHATKEGYALAAKALAARITNELPK